eukprot:m.249886 g.249886  ORF g.249886 m.249886 type:complete len:107 (+) comp15430_c0_seq7:120-440(+)
MRRSVRSTLVRVVLLCVGAGVLYTVLRNRDSREAAPSLSFQGDQAASGKKSPVIRPASKDGVYGQAGKKWTYPIHLKLDLPQSSGQRCNDASVRLQPCPQQQPGIR